MHNLSAAHCKGWKAPQNHKMPPAGSLTKQLQDCGRHDASCLDCADRLGQMQAMAAWVFSPNAAGCHAAVTPIYLETLDSMHGILTHVGHQATRNVMPQQSTQSRETICETVQGFHERPGLNQSSLLMSGPWADYEIFNSNRTNAYT